MDETQMRIAESARALLAAFRGKQVELAEFLGISQVAVSRKLNGSTRWSPADVEKLAKYYGVSVDQVMAGPRAWLGLPEDGRATRRYHASAVAAMAA